MNVPNEILASILNNLSPPDNDSETSMTLASCRLASHTFCSLATPLLFSSIVLTESETSDTIATVEKRAQDLAQILTNNNFIATSVHALKLSCHPDNLEDPTFGSIIAAILLRLPYIQNFVLKSSNTDFFGLANGARFSSIAKDLISAVQALLGSPNLTTINLFEISDFPFTLITASPNLKNLGLSRVYFSYMDGTSQPNLCYLDSLEINGSGLNSLGSVVKSHIEFAESFSRLKSLTIHNEDVRTLCGRDIALLASQTLTELLYTHGAISWDILEAVPYDLSRFPLLRHFTIRLRIIPEDTILMHNFLKHLLYISSSCSHIETLNFEISWYCDEDAQIGLIKDYFLPDPGWSTLDDILASAEFVSVHRLIFDLDITIDTWRMGLADEVYNRKVDVEKNLALQRVDALFPKFRALLNAQRTLETRVKFR